MYQDAPPEGQEQMLQDMREMVLKQAEELAQEEARTKPVRSKPPPEVKEKLGDGAEDVLGHNGTGS